MKSGRLHTFILGILLAGGFVCAQYSPVAAQPTTINVEIDWMSDGSHNHQPSVAEMQAVAQMFACHGITLNYVLDEAIPHITSIADSLVPGFFFTWSGVNSFRSLKTTYFDRAGGGWHYCIFGHQYSNGAVVSTSSGRGETGGDDFIVTLGTATGQIGTPFDRAATFAHELGHNLGLRHYGGADSAAGDFSPNYASIMSYQYQLTGVRSQMLCLDLIDNTALLKDLDYSNGRMPGLSENFLEEVEGLGIRSVDWDCDSTTESGYVAKDLDGRPWCMANGTRGILFDRNDWATLVDNAATGRLPVSEYETCISADETERYKMSPTSCAGAVPTLTSEPCVSGEMIWIDPSHIGLEDGRGASPYNTFLEGYNAAPNASVLYLQNGNLNMGGSLITLNKPLTLAGPGGVTITR
ncbi:MAG: hypothetical protein ACKVU1_01160 [bacterium]